jgi:hypothetical protein
MNQDGSLTSADMQRDSMTAEERAIDRTSRYQGKDPSLYVYDMNTNKAKQIDFK